MAKKNLQRIHEFRKKILPFAIGGLIVLIPLFILSMKYKESVLADSLMSFDEGYGTTSNSANTNVTGTVTNATWKPEELCVSSKCLYFDGTGDYVSYGDDSDVDFAGTDTFTIEGWFRTGDITSGQRTIVAKYNTGGGYKVYMDSNGYLLFGIDNDNSGFPSDSVTTSTTAFDDNKWHHFAAIKNGSTSITLYVDNIQYGTDSSITSATLVNSDNFYVGIDGDGSSNGWNGFLDEIKVYRSVRTIAQINTDFAGTTVNRGVVASLGPNQKALSDGLVGYWKMDENTGTTTADSSGNGNTATMSTPFWTTGKYGAGLNVGGTVDYINAGSATSLDDPTSWTFSAWAYSECSFEGYDDRLMEKAASTGIDLSITAETCTIRATQAVSGTDPLSLTSTSITSYSWVYVTIVYDDVSKFIKIYFNGVEQPYTTHTQGATSSTTVSDASGNLLIGNRSAFDRGYLGALDEVRYYNRALTSFEVSNLYNFTPGPVAYWKMDENAGGFAYDSSGNSNTGTLQAGGASPSWRNGKYGSGLYFDGSDYVLAGTNSTITNLHHNKFTVSAWIYPTSNPGTFETYEIVNKSSSVDQRWGLSIWNQGGTVRFRGHIDNAGGQFGLSLSNDAPTLNQWQYITMTYDDTGDRLVHLFLNGNELTYSSQTAFSATQSSDASFQLSIGAISNAGDYFIGKIDDVRAYNYTRTSKQIIEDMNAGHPTGGSPVGSQLIYWNLDESEGTIAHNSVSSQTALTGTLSAIQFYSQCKVNGCALTTATTGYISGGDISALDGATNLSFTTWYSYLDAGTQAIFSKWNNSNQDNFLISIESGQIKAYFASSATQTNGTSPYFITSNFNSNCTDFCHIAVIYDGTLDNTDRVKIFVNGIRMRGTVSGTLPTTTTSTSSNFKINASDDTLTFTGTIAGIDETKVYTSSLTPSEVLLDMNAGSSVAFGGVLGPQTNEGFGGNSPIAWWKYDDHAGSSAIDSSDNSYTQNLGASTAAPTWTIGKYGSALAFDGINDYAVTSGSIDLSTETTITVEFWLKWDSYANDDDLAMEFTPNLNANSGGFIIDPNFSTGSTFAAWQMNSSGTPSGAQFARPTAGAWHHYAIIFNKAVPSATDTIPYVDGLPITFTKQYTATMDNTFANNNLYIMSRAGTSLFGAGKMDDVKIYNYARSESQIAYDYNRGAPIAKYDLDECSGATIHNSSLDSNGNQISAYNGTFDFGASDQVAMGDCTTNANTPWYNGKNGKYNSSLNFDAIDDYVSMTAPPLSWVTGNFSVSFWIKTTSSTSNRIPLAKHVSGSNNGWFFTINNSEATKIDFYTPSSFISSKTAINDGRWHNIIGTWNGSTNTKKLYVDSKLEKQETGSAGVSNNEPITIGGITNHGAGNFSFPGQVDEVQIYGYILDTDKIINIYNENAAVRFGQ